MGVIEEENSLVGNANGRFVQWANQVFDIFRNNGFSVTPTWYNTDSKASGPYVVPAMVKYQLTKGSYEPWTGSLTFDLWDQFTDPQQMAQQQLSRWAYTQSRDSGVNVRSPLDPHRQTRPGVITPQTPAPPTPVPPAIRPTPGQAPPTVVVPQNPVTHPGPIPEVTAQPIPAPSPTTVQTPAAPPADKLRTIDKVRALSTGGQETWDGWGNLYKRVTGVAAPGPGSVGVARTIPMPFMSVQDWWALAFETAPPVYGTGPAPAPTSIPSPAPTTSAASTDDIMRMIRDLLTVLLGGR